MADGVGLASDPIATPEYKRLVFVDEMGAHTSPAPSYGYPPYGYPPRGRGTFFGIPSNGGTNTTLPSSMSLEGMGPSTAIEGSTTKEAFEAYTWSTPPGPGAKERADRGDG